MSQLTDIGKAIDDMLNTRTCWTKKEHNLYILLCQKVEQYQPRHKSYQLNSADKDSIIANIKERPWYGHSRHQSNIIGLIRKMDIVDFKNEKRSKDITFIIKIRFDTGYTLDIKYYKSQTKLKYMIYFKNNKSKGYVAYLNTDGDKKKQQELKLPEYDKLMGIISPRDLDRSDIFHMVAELVLFYDPSGDISNTHIGLKYPVSLAFLADRIP